MGELGFSSASMPDMDATGLPMSRRCRNDSDATTSEQTESTEVSVRECESSGLRWMSSSLSSFIVPLESREMPTRQSLRVGKGGAGVTDLSVGNTVRT